MKLITVEVKTPNAARGMCNAPGCMAGWEDDDDPANPVHQKINPDAQFIRIEFHFNEYQGTSLSYCPYHASQLVLDLSHDVSHRIKNMITEGTQHKAVG